MKRLITVLLEILLLQTFHEKSHDIPCQVIRMTFHDFLTTDYDLLKIHYKMEFTDHEGGMT